MKCFRCGRDLNKKSRYCIHCGFQLERSCLNCKSTIHLSDQFCHQCGTSLNFLKDFLRARLSRFTMPAERSSATSTVPVTTPSPTMKSPAMIPSYPSPSYPPSAPSSTVVSSTISSSKWSVSTASLMGIVISLIVVILTWLITTDVLFSLIVLFTILPTILFWTILKYFNERGTTTYPFLSGSSVVFFFYGVLMVIPLVVAEFMGVIVILFISEILFNSMSSFVILLAFLLAASFLEEIGKYVVIQKAVNDHGSNGLMKSIYFGIIAVLGFASIENILYVFGSLEEGLAEALFVSLIRFLLSVPMHVLTGTFIVKYYLKALRDDPILIYRHQDRRFPTFPPTPRSIRSFQQYHHSWHLSSSRPYLEHSRITRRHYLGIPILIHLGFNLTAYFFDLLSSSQIILQVVLFFMIAIFLYVLLYYNFKWFWKVKNMTLEEFLHSEPHL